MVDYTTVRVIINSHQLPLRCYNKPDLPRVHYIIPRHRPPCSIHGSFTAPYAERAASEGQGGVAWPCISYTQVLIEGARHGPVAFVIGTSTVIFSLGCLLFVSEVAAAFLNARWSMLCPGHVSCAENVRVHRKHPPVASLNDHRLRAFDRLNNDLFLVLLTPPPPALACPRPSKNLSSGDTSSDDPTGKSKNFAAPRRKPFDVADLTLGHAKPTRML